MKKYTLVQLMDIFEQHAKEAREMEMERCKKDQCVYIEQFCISDALYSMCEAICDRVKEENSIGGYD